MSLKCPFCGKEYFHDSKICQTCEDKSNNYGLIYTYKKSQKWNCGIFLEFDTLTFRHQKPDEVYIKIDSEHKFSNFKSIGDYNWNCDPRFRVRNFDIFKSEISPLGTIEKLPTKNSKILEKEKLAC